MLDGDTDTYQVWERKDYHPAHSFYGAVDLTVTEELDFESRSQVIRTRGMHQGTWYDREITVAIDPEVRPEDAASYRRSNGYHRVS